MNTLIGLLIVALIFAILWWGMTQLTLPPPAMMVLRVAFAVIMALVLLGMLTGHISLPRFSLN